MTANNFKNIFKKYIYTKKLKQRGQETYLKNSQQCDEERVEVAGWSTLGKVPPENHQLVLLNREPPKVKRIIIQQYCTATKAGPPPPK